MYMYVDVLCYKLFIVDQVVCTCTRYVRVCLGSVAIRHAVKAYVYVHHYYEQKLSHSAWLRKVHTHTRTHAHTHFCEFSYNDVCKIVVNTIT